MAPHPARPARSARRGSAVIKAVIVLSALALGVWMAFDTATDAMEDDVAAVEGTLDLLAED